MKLIKRNNYTPTMPTFFDDLFAKDFFGWDREVSSFKTTPAVNISENEDHYAIEVAAPGLTKDDFNIELDDNLLTISFEKKEETEEKGNFTRREFHYTSFRRSFTIPEGSVNGDKINAKYEDGILRLTLPKKEEAKAKAKKTIKIG